MTKKKKKKKKAPEGQGRVKDMLDLVDEGKKLKGKKKEEEDDEEESDAEIHIGHKMPEKKRKALVVMIRAKAGK